MMDYKDSKVPVFKASLKKDLLLSDQNKDLVAKENKSQSVEGINGLEIILGSMEEVNLSGNWPKKYGKNEYQPKFSEHVEYDYRTSYKDTKFYNVRFESNYFRKEKEFPEMKSFFDSVDKILEQTDKYK